MNILARHIKSLLLTHDHVSLPRFGTFFTDTEEIGYEQCEAFIPMRRVLHFTPEIDDTDTLLVESYAQTYNLAEPQAKARLSQHIDEAGQTLASTGTLDFDTLGMFNFVGGRITFEACKASLVIPSLYGLDAFSMPLLPTLATTHTDSKPADDKNRYVLSIDRGLVHTVATIAASILLFFVFSSPIGDMDNTHTASPDLSGILIPYINRPDLDALSTPTYVRPSRRNDFQRDEVPTDSIQTETQTQVEPTVETESDIQTGYTIVLASGVSMRGAETFVEQLKKEGLDETRIMTRGNMTRVVYNCYDSESQAYTAARQLQKRGGDYADAWVLKI